MEFKFDVKFLKRDHDQHGVSIWNGQFQRELSAQNISKLNEILDEMGKASCIAQGLGQPVTAAYLLKGTNHRLYLLADYNKNIIKGILKVGYKKLFIHNLQHEYVEMKPLCVLDFYIHDSCQRQNNGLCLFSYMLKSEKIEPRLIAYDAPSSKLLNFLNKHYGLKSFTPQNCNFVVYHDYFEPTETYQYKIPKQSPVIKQSVQEIKKESEVPVDIKHADVPSEGTENKIIEKEPKMEQNIEQKIEHEETKKNEGNDSYTNQLDWIQKQIEKTKIEISASEKKIYQHHLENYVSPYNITHPTRDTKTRFIKKFRE